jgi:pimeloyl-ACP methyl ester carboxylesterase
VEGIKMIIRRLIAIVIGVATFFLLTLWAAWVGYGYVIGLLPIGLQSELSEMGFSDSIYYLKDHDIYISLGWLLLGLSGGAAATLAAWDKSPPRISKLILIFTSLGSLIPLSVANYASFDLFGSRSAQAVMNIPIIFLGILAVYALYDIKAQSRSAEAVRTIATTFIVMQAIMVPALYSILWWLNFQNAISLAATRDLSPGWISALSGVFGFLFAVYKFFLYEKPEEVKEEQPKIWLPPHR